jgi:phenylalanyl-tRNA synthetase beta subunit
MTELFDETYSYGLNLKIKKNQFATIGKISANICKQFDIEQEVFYADIN